MQYNIAITHQVWKECVNARPDPECVLTGLDGNDTLDGGKGADSLLGGAGDDMYIVDNAADIVVENAAEGTDTVQASVSYALSDNVENLTLTGTAAISGTGNALDNNITGNSADNTLDGVGWKRAVNDELWEVAA